MFPLSSTADGGDLSLETQISLSAEMVKAFVLMELDPGSEKEVVEQVRGVEGVTEAHLVYGVYDVLAEIEVEELDDVKAMVSGELRQIEGVRKTTTLMHAG